MEDREPKRKVQSLRLLQRIGKVTERISTHLDESQEEPCQNCAREVRCDTRETGDRAPDDHARREI